MIGLARWLGLEPPPGAHWRSAELTLTGNLPGWTVLLCLPLLVGVAYLFYRGEISRLSVVRRASLIGLRAGVLVMLVGLIARPVVVAEFVGDRPRPVALLLDNSASMKQVDRRTSARDIARAAIARGAIPADANPEAPGWQSLGRNGIESLSRADIARAALQNARINLVERLARGGPPQAYLFGAKSRQVPPGECAAALKADDDRTALADVIAELLSGREGDVPANVVLITDGLDNASKATLASVADECRAKGVAVHVYGVGSTDAGVIRLSDAVIPGTLFYDDVVSIPIRWRARGLRQGTAVAKVMLGEHELARQEIPVKGGEGRATINFTPERKMALPAAGELVVDIRMQGEPGPADEVQKPVQFSDRRVRMLVIDDAPRWEFKFLQPALSRDRRVDARFLLAQGDPRALSSNPFVSVFPSREKLFDYDLVLLGDVPPAFLGVEGMKALADFVREGGGLTVIAGRKQMPAKYADTPLAEVLPVDFVPVQFPPLDDARPTLYQPALTEAGRRTEMLQLADTKDQNDKLWHDLPGFFWHYPVTKVRPGATTLITRPLPDGAQGPVLVSHYYGKGQVLFWAADETWRWRYNSGDRVYARLWGQVAYQLGLPHLLGHGGRAQLALDSAEAFVGRPGYIYARLFDAEYHPFVAERIPAELEAVDVNGERHTTPVELSPVPARPGEYRLLLPHDAPGQFELRLQKPVEVKFPFRVQLPPGHEAEPNALAEEPLRQLAGATGGGFYREEDLYRLPDALVPKSTPYTARQEALLWSPFTLCLFVGLLTAEWVARKFADLS